MYKYIRKTFYEDDNIKITLEEGDGNLMAHVAIYSFSKTILKQILEIWEDIKVRAYWQGYEEIYTYTAEERMPHFFKDGKEIGEFEKDGIKYKVWKWELN